MRPAALLVLLPFALAAAPARGVDTPSTDLWVVTSADVTSGSARFVTSLRILAPQSGAHVTLRFLPQSDLSGGSALGDNTAAPTASLDIAPGHTAVVDDVIATLFGGAAKAGGIHVVSDAPVVVMSQTLNVNGQSASGVPGTYGFAIPAQTLENAVGVGETAYVPYVSGSPGAGSGYRTNLFLLSGNAAATTSLHVRLVRADGSIVGESDYQLGKLSQTQINGIAGVFGSTAPNLTAFVSVTSGGPVFLGASVIDNAISSILYTPPVKAWLPRTAVFGLVLDDGGYDFPGRLDFVNGVPTFLSAGLVLDACPGATAPTLYFVQMGTEFGNGSFPPAPGGGFTIAGTMSGSGGSVAATVGGVVLPAIDGAISGQIVYTRSASASSCPGVSKSFAFVGRKVDGTP